MQSEHLTNLHLGWVIGGWLIAVAVTSGLYLGGVGLGLLGSEAADAVWVMFSLSVGFFVGGLFVGLRWTDAPILHGAAITFFSVIVWFGATLLEGSSGSQSLTMVLGLILLQLVFSVAGGWTGRRVSLGPTSTDTPS